MKEKAEIVPKQMIYLLFVCVVLLVATLYMPQPGLPPFTSAEVHFYDSSMQGLKIMPASCASNPNSPGAPQDPTWYHSHFLTTTGDAYGLKIPANATEYGAYATSSSPPQYICVTNTTGSPVFIPAKTKAELDAFKAHPPAGVTVYW